MLSFAFHLLELRKQEEAALIKKSAGLANCCTLKRKCLSVQVSCLSILILLGSMTLHVVIHKLVWGSQHRGF